MEIIPTVKITGTNALIYMYATVKTLQGSAGKKGFDPEHL